MNRTIEDIKKRKSIRRFNETQVEGDKLTAVIEAATYAPSASNEQSWHFTVIQNQDLLAEMKQLSEKMQKTAALSKWKKW